MTPNEGPGRGPAGLAALAERLRSALPRTAEDGTLAPDDVLALRLALADPGARARLPGAAPRDLFGAWAALPRHVPPLLRAIVEEDIRATMDLHPSGRGRVGAAARLHRISCSERAPRAVRRAASRWAARLWKRPALLRAAWVQRRRAHRFLHAGRPDLADLVAALGHRPSWLTRDFAEGVRVDPRCRGFWHDEARRVVYGYVIGIDAVATEGGVVCHEANLDPGILDELRKPYFQGSDPIPPALAEFAGELGLRRVVWLGADLAPLAPWAHEQLWHGLTSRGLELEVLEDARLPPRTSVPPGVPLPARALLPPLSPPEGSLVLRLRTYQTGSDLLVSSKEAVTACMLGELERAGESRVHMLPLTADPGEVTLPTDPGVPNLVYKYPATDRGTGVHMLRATSRVHALELARALDARTGERDGRFQRWVHAPLGPDRTLSEYRVMLAVTPLGVAGLGSRKRQGIHRVPDELPPGVVEDRRPFILTGFFGNTSGERHAPEEAAVETAVTVFGERMASYLRRTFVWHDGGPGGTRR